MSWVKSSFLLVFAENGGGRGGEIEEGKWVLFIVRVSLFGFRRWAFVKRRWAFVKRRRV